MATTNFPQGLSSFGIPLLGADIPTITGHVFWVDSGGTGGANGEYDTPYLTLDAAVNRCVASRGDLILVKEGHAENITAAAGVDADIIGITIVGLGRGALRPTFTFTTVVGADIDFDAASITWANCIFDATSLDNVTMPLDVNAANCKFVDCEFLYADSGAQAAGMVTTDSNQTKFIRCKGRGSSDTGCNQVVEITGTPDGVELIDCEFYGDFANAAVYGTDIHTNTVIRGGSYKNLQAGDHAIEFTAAATGTVEDVLLITNAKATAIDAGAMYIGRDVLWSSTTGGDTGATSVFVEPDSTSNILGANDADNDFSSANVVANVDGSVLERLEDLVVKVTAVDDIIDTEFPVVVTAVGAVADAALADTIEGAAAATQSLLTDLKGVLQRIGADNANNTAATTLVAANRDGSILERLEQLEATVQKTIAKVQTTPSGGADALFTITGGPVHVVSIWGVVTTVLAGVANGTLQATVTTPAGTVALSTTVAIDNDAAGTTYTFVGPTGVLTPTTAGAVLIDMGSVALTETQYIVPIGNINFLTSAAQTGAITWYMSYIPSPGAVVVAA